jgi:hypothetical protein
MIMIMVSSILMICSAFIFDISRPVRFDYALAKGENFFVSTIESHTVDFHQYYRRSCNVIH